MLKKLKMRKTKINYIVKNVEFAVEIILIY